ncbi:hypothetical protein Pryu01_02813 [Paraliobacillus ryukyuensis]|uniref:Uncharacterized protein n=1 Tax=Paraliobacillus ryukyuensis TaxID=200904 RepID=A0A366E8N5_9BACI|nr:hypothetical protein DES48_106142 [Paraliobacillus ryukyuensis]
MKSVKFFFICIVVSLLLEFILSSFQVTEMEWWSTIFIVIFTFVGAYIGIGIRTIFDSGKDPLRK